MYGDNASYLKLGMIWPLPEKLILDFAEHVDKVVVLEELDPFIENHCRKLGLEVVGKETFPICGEFSQNLVRTALGGDAPEELPMRFRDVHQLCVRAVHTVESSTSFRN